MTSSARTSPRRSSARGARTTRGAALLAVALLSAACVSDAPRPPPRATEARALPLAEAAALQEAATRPNRGHRTLDPLVGAWKTTNVAVDRESRESDAVPGRAAIEWVLDGRFLRVDQTLDVPGGRTYASSGYLGWDEAHGEYQWLMVSDLQTGMGVARGTGELAKDGIRFTLQVVDPRYGNLARATSVLRLIAPDHLVLEQLGEDAAGLERVVRRTHYERASPAG